MIASITGRVVAVGATWAEVVVGGIGLRPLCTPRTTSELRTGSEVTLATALVVREDSLTLYGFLAAAERDCFELLQSATGIGPKIAQAALSVLSPDELRAAIAAEDLPTITKVPGVGRKGAQRIVLELKDKFVAFPGALSRPAESAAPAAGWRDQVAQGLINLGWSARDAEAACEQVSALAETDPQPGVGELMRAALRTLAR